MTKIAVYGICKNEEQFVERCLTSCLEADYIVITDTGSTDSTLEKLNQFALDHPGPTYVIKKVVTVPWRFDAARNRALDLIPEDADFCVPIDLDEVLQPGWRQGVEDSVAQGATRLRYWFTWSWNADGSPGIKFIQDKMHARQGYRWRYHAHETLMPHKRTTPEVIIQNESIELHHHPDPTKSRSQYFPLLESTVREWPMDDRPAYYFARELFFLNDKRAAKEFLRYLALPTATWKEERSQALIYLSKIHLAKQEFDKAIEYAVRAVSEAPRREAFLAAAEAYYYQGGDLSSYAITLGYLQALFISPVFSGSYLNEPSTRNHYPHDIAAMCYFKLGDFEKAAFHSSKALELVPEGPDHLRIATNLQHFNSLLASSQQEPK